MNCQERLNNNSIHDECYLFISIIYSFVIEYKLLYSTEMNKEILFFRREKKRFFLVEPKIENTQED